MNKCPAPNIVYKTLGVKQLGESIYPASTFISVDSDEIRTPQRFIHATVGSKANRDDITITDRQNKWKIYQSTT